MSPTARVASLAPSAIRALGAGAPPDAIPLGLGQPGWFMPQVAVDALAGASWPGGYGPNEGLAELREAIAGYHDTRSVDEVMVTAGSQAALFALFTAHAGPDRPVLVPDPGFPAYRTLATLCGAEAAPYPLDPRGGLDVAAFARALDEHPRAEVAVINHPGNPTGGGATLEALRQVAGRCRERGVLLISDEVYRELYAVALQPSLRDVSDDGVVVSSVSKAWGAPGLRVGWAVGDPDVLAPARVLHNAMTTSAAVPSQVAAAALLNASGSVLPQAREELRRRWAVAREVLGVEPAAGGFYLWWPLPPPAQPPRAAAPAFSPPFCVQFCERLRDEAGVVVVPGTVFGQAGAGHVRVSLAAEPSLVREGLCRIVDFWARP